jgi:hypothetical protein
MPDWLWTCLAYEGLFVDIIAAAVMVCYVMVQVFAVFSD